MSHPHLDIVMPVHNATDFVKRCIGMLYEHTRDFRLIIVDDHSDEQTREFLYGPDCLGKQTSNLYVRTNSQRWFTRASNIGLMLVRTERAILLNSDVELGPDWVEELYDVWGEAEASGLKVGLVGDRHADGESRRWARVEHPGYVTGHCWLMSMQAMREIATIRGTPGLILNELRQDCIHICSDREASYDLNRAGWATVDAFHAAIGHHGHKSWGANLGRVFNLTIRNMNTGEVG